MSKIISFTDSNIKSDRLLAALPSTMSYFPEDAKFVTMASSDIPDRRKIMSFLSIHAKGWSRYGSYKTEEVFAFELSGDATLFRLRF